MKLLSHRELALVGSKQSSNATISHLTRILDRFASIVLASSQPRRQGLRACMRPTVTPQNKTNKDFGSAKSIAAGPLNTIHLDHGDHHSVHIPTIIGEPAAVLVGRNHEFQSILIQELFITSTPALNAYLHPLPTKKMISIPNQYSTTL